MVSTIRISTATQGLSSSRAIICPRCCQAVHRLTRRRFSPTATTPRHEAAPGEGPQAEKSTLDILEERGLLKQLTGRRHDAERIFSRGQAGVYAGFDPTAPSLHVGHVLPLMALFWMYIHGHRTFALVGGATARIGDPTGRLKTRDQQGEDQHARNASIITAQLEAMWTNVKHCARRNGLQVREGAAASTENNARWWRDAHWMEVVATLGHGVRVGAMLARETVKQKLSKGDGMSFAEFAYPLMQAWDWWHLFRAHNVQVQIGGSDQYGNITAGLDALAYMREKHSPQSGQSPAQEAFGMTVPLLQSSSGEKFGKSAGNAVWLDAQSTSPFDLYAYFMKTPDALVEEYLRRLTFMPLDGISSLISEHLQHPKHRIAQARLAEEFVSLVHGTDVALNVASRHKMLFSKRRDASQAASDEQSVINFTGTSSPASSEVDAWRSMPPDLTLPLARDDRPDHVLHIVRRLLVGNNSGSEARRLIRASAVYVLDVRSKHDLTGREAIEEPDQKPQWIPVTLDHDLREFMINGDRLVLRRGKSKVRVVQFTSQEGNPQHERRD